MTQAIEVDSGRWEKITTLSKIVEEAIKERNCAMCDQPLDLRKIMYVVCSKGYVVWWHYYTEREKNIRCYKL
jgi:hypothetical protein